MSRYKVLIDTSVWIQYFQSGGFPKLDKLIEENLACINELIYTELAPVLIKRNQNEILEGLIGIERIPLSVDWEIVRRYQVNNLLNGINKVGIPDLIILQQVIDEKISLFTLDNHFQLMQKHLNFEIFNS